MNLNNGKNTEYAKLMMNNVEETRGLEIESPCNNLEERE